MSTYEDANWMPVEEALQKVCPMTRSSGRSPNCIGPQCMAWRWRKTPVQAEAARKFGLPGLLEGRCGMAG